MAALCWLPACASTAQNAPPPAYPLYKMDSPQHTVAGPGRSSLQEYAPAPIRAWPRSRQVAQWYPPGGRVSPRWTTIVLHHSATSAGGARRFDKFHRESNGWDELGYHFVIGNGTDTPDGFIEVGSRWYKQKHGAHCKTSNNYFNEHGIGICLVGDFTKGAPTPRQVAAARELVGFLSDVCRIPAARVTTHEAVTRKTACPGQHFPIQGIRNAALGSTSASSAIGR